MTLQGHQGPVGPSGLKGDIGPSGLDGLPGISGANGRPAEKGEKGKSFTLRKIDTHIMSYIDKWPNLSGAI